MRLHRPSELFWARVRVRVRVRVSAAVRLHRPSKELGVRVEGQSFGLVWNTVIAKSLPLSTVIGVLCALGSWVCSKKRNCILRCGEKGCATYGRNGCLGGGIKDSAPKKELNSEIWGKGVCDIWEKWVVWVGE